MFRRAKTVGLTILMALAGVAAPAVAGSGSRVQLFVSSAAGDGAVPYLSFRGAPAMTGQFDYALFASELLAYVTKEVMPDSREEYGRSPLGSHWSPSMPGSGSQFGSHCLTIVGRIGSAIPNVMPSTSLDESPSAATYALRAATTGLALRQIWQAFERDIHDDRGGGFSLDPKVSSRRVGVNLTLHW